MEPVPTTTISLPTASVNKDLTKESTFKQRMVSKLKNIKSYLWAVLKTFVTLGIIKFKVSPHKVNSINLMGDNKYINFFSDDSIHIFVGNHLNRNNIGPSHRSNIPTNAENVLTKEIIRQEITTAIENAQDKPITFTLNTSDYKADTNINPDAQELSLEDGLKEIIYFLKTKSNEKSTFNVFLETNNNTLVKDKLFDIYNAVSDSSTGLEKQEDSYPEIDIVSQTGSSQNLRISTDSVKTDENSDKHKVTSKETELSDTPNNDSDSSVLNKSKEPQLVTYNIKEFNKNKKLLNKFIIAIFTEKNRPTMVDSEDKINLLSNVLSNKLKSIENIESLKIYMTKMPEINLVKLGFLQNYDVSKFKYYALSSLMSKGYQYADYLTIINELFDKSNSKEELEDKLYKYPNKEFNYIDTAKKLDISEEEVKKKIKSLADSILKKEGTKSSSYATTMAMCLLEAGQDNIDNLPSIHNFMFGYTTQQEYQEIYNRCEKILQTTKEYSKEEMEIALRICFANYEKNDVENQLLPFNDRQKSILI